MISSTYLTCIVSGPFTAPLRSPSVRQSLRQLHHCAGNLLVTTRSTQKPCESCLACENDFEVSRVPVHAWSGHCYRGGWLQEPHDSVVTTSCAWKTLPGIGPRKFSRRKSGGAKKDTQRNRPTALHRFANPDTAPLQGLDVPLCRARRPSLVSWLPITVVKLEDSSLFGSASWRAIDDSVARVDAAGRPMSEPSKQDQAQKQDHPRMRRRRSSSSALLEFSSANRVPLCWALSVVLILVSSWPGHSRRDRDLGHGPRLSNGPNPAHFLHF